MGRRMLDRSPSAEHAAPKPFRLEPPNPPMTLEELEKAHIQTAINWANGNKTLAARVLGVDRRTLFRKLAKYRGKV